ncbi:MAG: PhnD/SsuA/transferrin family substrate-binding protein [Rhodoferax sp.]|nr:PhnD/SsuA/transferrin family substrate-binding protein [Rhodoferax sp.]
MQPRTYQNSDAFPKVLALLLTSWLLAACSPETSNAPPATLQYSSAPKPGSVPLYRLAVHPLHNPEKLSDAYQPLVDHLNRQLQGVKIELESSRDYQAYEKKFRQRLPAFLLPNPWQTLQAQKVGYHVIAMAGDAQDFKGIFLVRKDSGISQPADLKGKSVSYPSYTALAAAIMPQVYLHGHGINIRSDIQNVYVGSQESSMMNVVLKQTAAGATWPPPWRLFQQDHPQEAAQLRVVWETPSLINNSVMARDDVPATLTQQVSVLLLALHRTAQGQAILQGMQTAKFHPANDTSYQVVADYVARFERDIRPVESPQ